MHARIESPALTVPGALEALQGLSNAVSRTGIPETTVSLVELRASQINGCSFCVDGGVRHARKAGETDERLFAVAVWRETPYFTDAERAALSLAEAMTRLADRPESVTDEIWDTAAKHFTEEQLAGIVLWVSTTNLFNRSNASTRQLAPQNW